MNISMLKHDGLQLGIELGVRGLGYELLHGIILLFEEVSVHLLVGERLPEDL
jgi:hypothetical protein